jgi:hypothetical protein
MDRQRAAIVGAAAALVVIVVLGVGFVMGRASAGDDSSRGDASATSADSEGLPVGPSRMEDGVPLGFERSDDGAVSAAVAWLPWLVSSPAAERPEGMESVLAPGVEAPMPEGISERLQFAVWAAGAEMTSSDEATVTLLGTLLNGEPGGALESGVWPLIGRLVWDSEAEDWRVTEVDYGEGPIDEPTAGDLSGLRVIRSTGGVLAGPVVEEVPGD